MPPLQSDIVGEYHQKNETERCYIFFILVFSTLLSCVCVFYWLLVAVLHLSFNLGFV